MAEMTGSTATPSRLALGFLYRPEVRQARLPGAAAGSLALPSYLGRQQRRRQPAPAEHRLGLRFPGPHVGLRRLAVADRVLQRLHLRPRLLGRPAEYAAGRRASASLPPPSSALSIGIARLSSNWLVARLATVYVETVRNVPLLLQLFLWYFAVLKNLPGAAPEPRPAGRRLPQRAGPLSAGARAAAGLRGWSPSPSCCGIAAAIGLIALGAPAPGLHRPALPGAVARARLCSSARRSSPLSPPAPRSPSTTPSSGLQLPGRHGDPARVDGAAAGPVDLHRQLHRRDRARRHPGRAQGPEGGGAGDRPLAAGRRCAWSSSRRRCASSFPRSPAST